MNELTVTVTCPTSDSFDPAPLTHPDPNPSPVPNPQPSHHKAALRSCSTRLLTGRGSLLH